MTHGWVSLFPKRRRDRLGPDVYGSPVDDTIDPATADDVAELVSLILNQEHSDEAPDSASQSSDDSP